jgi:glycerate 2-kinase
VLAFTNAGVKRGVELVVAATKLDEHMKGASLAVTGEGRVDFQTAFGKTPAGVAQCARRHGVPVVAIGGGLSDDANGVFQHGIDGLGNATANPMPLEVAIMKSREYLQNAAERVARLIVIGQRMGGSAAAVSTEESTPVSNGHGNGNGAVLAQRNNPVKRTLRAKRIHGLTRAAVELAQRRRQRMHPAN